MKTIKVVSLKSPFKLALSLCIFLLYPTASYGTTVTGFIKNGAGVALASGTITLQLSQDGTVAGPGFIYANTPVACAVTAGVIVSCTVTSNDDISPAGTYYKVRIVGVGGAEVMRMRNYTISGATWDIGDQVPLATAPEAAGAYQIMAQGGTKLARQRTLNFIGASVSCVNNSSFSRTDCTITGGVTASGTPSSGNIAKFTSAMEIAPAAASNIVGLFTGCSGSLLLGADGQCHAASANNAVLYAADYAGATFDVKVAACIAAVIAAGGGTCDARALTGAQSMADNLTVGDTTTMRDVTLLLGNMVLTRASGKQIFYTDSAKIIGKGTVLGTVGGTRIQGHDSVAAIAPVAGALGSVHNAVIRDIGIIDTGTAIGGSIGLAVGNASVDVTHSQFENIQIQGVDIALSVGGKAWGCTCYNKFSAISAMGVTIGSQWLSGANSNDWFSGLSQGATGLLINGATSLVVQDRFFGLNIESSATQAIHISGNAAGHLFWGVYSEGNPISVVLDYGVWGNKFLFGGGQADRTAMHDNSGNPTNDFMFNPKRLIADEIHILGSANADHGAFNFIPTMLGAGGPPFDVFLNLMNGDTYNSYTGLHYGATNHADLKVGGLKAIGGFGTGSIVTTALPTPTFTSANLATHGTAGSTSYTYYAVCRDKNDKVTLPSAAATITTGNATLDSTNYIVVTPPGLDGCYAYDILKGNTSTLLANTRSVDVVNDQGQATSGYTVPTRNTTGDTAIAGLASLGVPLASSSGGTGNQYTRFTGPTTAEKTFTLPNADATILTTNAGVTVAQVAAVLKTRQFGFMIGSDTGGALADTDDQAGIFYNGLGQGITITNVWCQADAGTPIIQLQKDDGSAANMLTADLTCATAAGASTTSFVSGKNNVAAGNRINFLTVTAGGVAKRITVFATYTLD